MIISLENQRLSGKALGEAIAAKADFGIFWFIHHSVSNSCIHCGKQYKGVKRGWLIRHYKQTGHWREHGSS